MPRTFRIASLGFLLVFLSAGVEIDSLDGAERELTLAERARQEGELIIWAVGEIQFQTMVADRFKKKYPFMRRVEAIRLASEKLRTRLLIEAQSGKKSNVDVIGVSGFELLYLANKGFLDTLFEKLTVVS